MKFIIIIYTTNKLTVVEMEDIRGVRLRKFKLRKIVLGVRMHFHHTICPFVFSMSFSNLLTVFPLWQCVLVVQRVLELFCQLSHCKVYRTNDMSLNFVRPCMLLPTIEDILHGASHHKFHTLASCPLWLWNIMHIYHSLIPNVV